MGTLRTLKLVRNGYIIISLVFCALGVWIVLNPYITPLVLCQIIGILFIVDGILKMVSYFSRDFYDLAFQFDFAFGILMTAVGIILLARVAYMEALVYVIFGLMILTDALFKVQTCMDAKKFGLDTLWWRLLLVAIATGTIGTILLIQPVIGLPALSIWLGSAFLAEGILNLLVAVFTVRILDFHP
ncbi:MAG: DUF308 domain-containing protein [Blautia sp.]|nr:DUF308 domain-containing protein [Blautia sp.]